MKKILSVLLVICMCCSVVLIVGASDADAKVYNVYGDGMLFKQNEDAVLAGTAVAGSIISAELYNAENILVASGTSITGSDGIFSVSFDAPAGGYEKYSVVLKADGTHFETIENVVFGELWIASGQSNMQYPLAQEKLGSVMYENREKLSEWLRVLLVPAVPEYKGSTALVPCEPQQDISGAEWVTGEDESIYVMSAVAYFFAADMMEETDMPVGILNVPLGGSVISSWISRAAIDSDPDVKNDLISFGEYYAADSWNESERSIYYDMTANYNLKIEALRNFRPSGMIWYQGESDVIFGKTPEQYSRMFDLMQRSYTELFGYEDGLLPIVYTQLAAYEYHEDNGTDLLDMNIGFAEMQKDESESRAVISMYDVPLTYIDVAGAIHPDSKKEIGERMAYAASGLVYGSGNTYTAATLKNSYISDGKVYVEIENAGDSLMCSGDTLKGFAVAGSDGVYVQADAEIINSNTVVIYNEKVAEPVSASYAYCLGNMRSNLYSCENGKVILPVSPFVTARQANAYYWYDKQWADCDDENIWHLKDDVYTGYHSAWKSENATFTFDLSSAFSGENGLHIVSDADEFSVSPVLTVKNGLKTVKFKDEGYDYSNYGAISFNVRNNGEEDIVFEGIRIYASAVTWYSSTSGSFVIPADGEWHEIVTDINNLYLYGIDTGIVSSNNRLDKICGAEFCFSGADADISFDNVRFSPVGTENEHNSKADIFKFGNFIEVVKIFAYSVVNYFAEMLKS